MDLSIYNIIRGPRVTHKAYDLNQKFQQLVLDIHPKANKGMVKEALKKLFNVEAANVRIVVRKGRRRRSGRFVIQGSLNKKAIVTLKEGHAVNLGVDAPAVYAAEEAAKGPQFDMGGVKG
ncbi:MAG: 50S ribosomal protein L23 [candidate division TM6 bacterium GW2011_GWE2_42_60]|nr:MAG: 50S ribosomal protein L23 [candidate division TM6 bacterium GW2011_GWE2_42_60]HBY05575.1 50S ribosomal protein L23 [Candidatus Dependentiae bacterium]